MQKSCKWCGRIHPINYTCPMKPQPRRKNTRAQRFRNTGLWKRTRQDVNTRDLHLCRLCLAAGNLMPHGLSTHHIIPLEESMEHAADPDWCITLCDQHHKEADAGQHDRRALHELALSLPRLPD